MTHYDAIIIGAGQGGSPLAKKLAKAGKKVALIEKRWIGGTCINDGCSPTKAMLASAKAVYDARNASDMGIYVGDIKVGVKTVKKRKDKIVEAFRGSAQKGLEETEGLTIIFGEATFSGEKEVTVTADNGEEEVLEANLIFIDTGAKSFVPEIKGLKHVDYLTSTTLLDLEETPKHLIIVGGNYIGLELGQLYYRLGAKVTILEKSDHILGREDKDVSEEISKILIDEGLQIFCGVDVNEIEAIEGKENEILVHYANGKQNSKVKGSHLLMATGRVPQTDALNLEKSGVETDEKGYIKVNDRLETNVKGIYALGDVKGGPEFTHISYNDYAILYRNLMENGDFSIKDRPVPYCMFTDPQMARIGISEQEAKEKGLDFAVAKVEMRTVGRAVETGQTKGFLKAVVDKKSKKILGACMLSAEGGEIMTVVQMAMEAGFTSDQLAYFVFAHPTYSEALNTLFSKFD